MPCLLVNLCCVTLLSISFQMSFCRGDQIGGLSTPSFLISDRPGGALLSPDSPQLSIAVPAPRLPVRRRFGGGWWLLTSFELRSRGISYILLNNQRLVLQDHSCLLTPQ